MILFIGDKERGYFIEEVARQMNTDCGYVLSNGHIKEQTNDILLHQGVEFILYDIEGYIDEASEIAKEIANIQKCNNAKPIIYAPGYNPKSQIIRELLYFDIKNYILGTNLSDMKDQLIKNITGYYDENGFEILEYIKQEETEKESRENYNFKLIGIAGACQRIGTTTHAIQIVKYLILKGYKACYIHINNTQYIENMKEWFNVETDLDLGKITYQSIDHFYNIEKISDIKQLGYDYYIYDYGVYFNPDFNKVSFLEKDIRLFVVGSEPTELPKTYDIIQNAFYDNAKYMFNYASPNEEKEIKVLMDEKADDTYIYSIFTPDKYVLGDIRIYEQMIPVEGKNVESVQKKKKGIFQMRRKKGGKK